MSDTPKIDPTKKGAAGTVLKAMSDRRPYVSVTDPQGAIKAKEAADKAKGGKR